MEWKNKIDLPGEVWQPYFKSGLFYSNYGRAYKSGQILRNASVNYKKLLEINHGIIYCEIDYTNEIWKAVLDFEGLYEISNKGRIRIIDKFNDRNRTDIIFNNDKPIASISLYKENKSYQYFVCELVARNFLENPYKLEYSSYKDVFQLSNNEVNNIFWTSMPIDPWRLVSIMPDIILYNTFDYLYEFDFEWAEKQHSGRLKFVYFKDAFKVHRLLASKGIILSCRTREQILSDSKTRLEK